ncbi:hypothetical protein M405DRAFT_928893 [Rhizopogon salebrosus TDB-379]|nr:hypothetical protein M405DRAFT_928893 [Rhizopogon salebrosus TDB-379]
MSKNIVLFGETGAGKSSVLNLLAGCGKAKTSHDMLRCTTQWQKHSVVFDGCVYHVFDTAGLVSTQHEMKDYLDSIVNAYNLITKLKQEGSIDLLLLCMRAGPHADAATAQTNYRLFYEWLCERKVPIVLVLTGLEREPDNMEDWWTRNKHNFARYEIHVAGHACITAADHLDGRPKQLYEDSHRLVRDLVMTHTQGEGGTWDGGTWDGDEGLFTRFLRKLMVLLQGEPRRKDVVGVLTNRCHIPLEEAKQLAGMIGFNPAA